MAHLSGIISKISGSAGNLTFQRSNGMTYIREKVTQVANPRSEGQMRTRTKFTNIVAMYKGIRPLLKNGFESKPKNLSDYNMFVKVNMQRTPVYLTKQLWQAVRAWQKAIRLRKVHCPQSSSQAQATVQRQTSTSAESFSARTLPWLSFQRQLSGIIPITGMATKSVSSALLRKRMRKQAFLTASSLPQGFCSMLLTQRLSFGTS